MREKDSNTVTLDTGALPADELLRAADGLDFDFKVVTVTFRETAGTNFAVTLESILETGVYGESTWGNCVFGDEPGPPEPGEPPEDRLETVLEIISNGGFPARGKREALTDGQVSQLRDAMIFEAHAREGRDIFITLDKKAFFGPKNVPDSVRAKLQERFKTLIMTPEEFMAHCADLKVRAK